MEIALLLLCAAIGIIAYFFYREWKRRRYVITVAKGEHLDSIGLFYGMPRKKWERDKDYRERIRDAIVNIQRR